MDKANEIQQDIKTANFLMFLLALILLIFLLKK